MTQFSWVNDSCAGIAPCAIVVPEQSYDFHSWAFDVGAAVGMNAFEIDFADYIFPFENLSADVRAFDEYFAGVSAAATEHAFPVQLCMSLPLMMLASVAWPAVTNARLQADGYATTYARFDIFQTSLLYSSLAVAPFLDNVWTTSCQPAWDNSFGNSTCEGHVEGLIAIATLGAGPVGFGDRVGFTNATLLNMTSRADGVLLQPSLPAVNIDAFFADRFPPQGTSPGMARVTAAPTFVPFGGAGRVAVGSGGGRGGGGRGRGEGGDDYAYPPPAGAALFITVFGTFVGEPIAVAPVDVWPPLPLPGGAASASPFAPAAGYYVQMLSRARLCVDGVAAVASGCANFSASADAAAPLLTVDTGPFDHEVFSVSPVLAPPPPEAGAAGAVAGAGAGWALLGELSKFARVSRSRVAALDVGATCGAPEALPLCTALVGAAGERVELALVDPRGIVRVTAVALGADGAGALTCACAAGGGACACSG
jgi:hypothetical protein